MRSKTLSGWGLWFPVVLLSLGLIFGVWLAIDWYREQLFLEARGDVLFQAGVFGGALTNAVNRRLALLQGLRAYTEGVIDRDLVAETFESYASGLAASMEGIRTLAIAPAGIHELVYPAEGNEGVLGHNLLTDERPAVREDVARTIATGEVALSGPYELRQGGFGLIARQAIDIDEEFWGLVAIVVDMGPLLAEAGLALLPDHLTFALTGLDGQLILGAETAATAGSIRHEIPLPEGAWTLHLMPSEGWDAVIFPAFLAMVVPSVLMAGFLLVLLHALYRRHAVLSRLVAARTKDLRASESRWRSLVEDTPDHVLSLDLDLVIEFANHASPGLSVDDLVGQPVHDFVIPADRERVRRTLTDVVETGTPARYETTYSHDGEVIYYESRVVPRWVSGEMVGLMLVARDISLLKRSEMEKLGIEQQLRQAQKLESLGTLAGGMAHEINNPLTGVINYADLISQESDYDRHVGFAEQIMAEGKRVAAIVRNLLSFSRQEDAEMNPERLDDIVQEAVELVGAAIRRDQIAVQVKIPDDLPEVLCQSQRIQQVIINLLLNSRHALLMRYIGHDDRKAIEIACDLHRIDGAEWVRTSITDYGVGIAPEAIDRVFDPFFTTKPRNEGTGLGLSVSYGIIRDHGGTMTVESTPGEYTVFAFDLKVAV